MSYAIKTGNRLMLDPLTLYNNSVPWWNEQNKETKKTYKHCLEYGKDKGYTPDCAVNYLILSRHTMIQMDKEDSYLQVTGAGDLNIKTVQQLYEELDKHGIFYIPINSTYLNGNELIENYYDVEDPNVLPDHAVVLTAVGEIAGLSGIYVEILNSWGYKNGYDGLHYVKVAESDTSDIVNNMKMLNSPIYVEVERLISIEDAVILSKVFAVLFLITLLTTIVFLILFIICCKKARSNQNNENDIELGLTEKE
jgi:hypothetical protein